MNILDCIHERGSGRSYTDEQISKDVLKQLIVLGTKAPTGSNLQPWGFVLIEGKEEIARLSEETKQYLLDRMAQYPHIQKYEGFLRKPGSNVFNHASTLLVIYGDTNSRWYQYDCTLAAGNIMLAAYSMGIGTCWIGFAQNLFNTPEFKAKYQVPEHFELVCPMSLGYLNKPVSSPPRKPPVVFNW